MPQLAYKYAGILGTLAMSVVVLRAVKDAASPTSVLWTAIGFLAVFSATGLILGWVANGIVVESVRSQVEEQLRSQSNPVPQKPTQSTAMPT
jgi:hypothetical protein